MFCFKDGFRKWPLAVYWVIRVKPFAVEVLLPWLAVAIAAISNKIVMHNGKWKFVVFRCSIMDIYLF